jgi:hypothetical protein
MLRGHLYGWRWDHAEHKDIAACEPDRFRTKPIEDLTALTAIIPQRDRAGVTQQRREA